MRAETHSFAILSRKSSPARQPLSRTPNEFSSRHAGIDVSFCFTCPRVCQGSFSFCWQVYCGDHTCFSWAPRAVSWISRSVQRYQGRRQADKQQVAPLASISLYLVFIREWGRGKEGGKQSREKSQEGAAEPRGGKKRCPPKSGGFSQGLPTIRMGYLQVLYTRSLRSPVSSLYILEQCLFSIPFYPQRGPPSNSGSPPSNY